MAIKKSLMVAGAVASIGLASAAVVPSFASAETSGSTKASLVDRLAEKFSLNKDEVQAVFDEEHEARRAEHEAKLEERLSEAVSEGKLTEDQKAKILAKLEELHQQREEGREEFQDTTKEERREAMKQKHDELKAWAEENDIPLEYLRFGRHRGHGPGNHL